MNAIRVDIWSDVVCPFCYIGKKRLEHVAAEAGLTLDVHWHSFELDPNAPAKHNNNNTERLAKKYGRSYAEMEQMERNVAAMAAEEGIDFQWQKAQSGNTFDAHRLIHFAASKGLANEAKEALCYAYMSEGVAIGEQANVVLVAQRIGLNADEVKAVLDSDAFAAEVRHDEEIARSQLQVSGVPFFVFNQRLALSGAQPREVFLQALQQAQTVDGTDVNTDSNAAHCNDDNCEIPTK